MTSKCCPRMARRIPTATRHMPRNHRSFGDAHFDTLIIGGDHVRRSNVARTDCLGYRCCENVAPNPFHLHGRLRHSRDAGRLADRRVTARRLFTEELKARFPKVCLEEDRIFISARSTRFGRLPATARGLTSRCSCSSKTMGPDLARSVAPDYGD